MQTLICKNITELPRVAQEFLEATKNNSIYIFNAGMGVGKTTFIKALCTQLGVIDVVASPTFAIINEYKTKHNSTIYHFDLYRLTSVQDVQNIGVEDYFYSGNMCFIEWPELALSLLPQNYVTVYITEDDDGSRVISFLNN